MKTARPWLLCLIFGLFAGGALQLQAAPPSVSGIVTSTQRNGPVAGVTVSLVNQVAGRGAPSYSGKDGSYSFSNVPVRPEPYFVEVYWGTQLLYRGQVTYTGAPLKFDITLP